MAVNTPPSDAEPDPASGDEPLSRCLMAFEGVGLVLPAEAAWGRVALRTAFATRQPVAGIARLGLGWRRRGGLRGANVAMFSLWYPDRARSPQRGVHLKQSFGASPTADTASLAVEAEGLVRAAEHGGAAVREETPASRDESSQEDMAFDLAGTRITARVRRLTSPLVASAAFPFGSVHVDLVVVGAIDVRRVLHSLVPLDRGQVLRLLAAADDSTTTGAR